MTITEQTTTDPAAPFLSRYAGTLAEATEEERAFSVGQFIEQLQEFRTVLDQMRWDTGPATTAIAHLADFYTGESGPEALEAADRHMRTVREQIGEYVLM